MSQELIKVGITHGDFNGIGYEVIIKALSDERINELFTPIVYGSSRVASYHKNALGENEFNFNLIKKANQANPKRSNIINCFEQEVKIELGQSTAIAGEMSFKALEQATEDLKNKQIDVLVTAPINKKNIQSKDFNFPGHTEYLAQKFNSSKSLMLMVSDTLRVGVMTGHVPLSEVSKKLTIDGIVEKVRILQQSLLQDFGIRKPKIALLGLNPHAGDNGLIGTEEETIIKPAVEKAFKEGIMAFGPFSADGFFGSSTYKSFDGILAMYHDQGLIPFKALAFDSGVNFTAGLPFVRTSPAHGTAYELAGKNLASADSMRAAIYLACDIYRNRMLYDEITANPLKKTVRLGRDN